MTETRIPVERARARVEEMRSEVATCKAIADWAQNQADEAHRDLIGAERRLTDLISALVNIGYQPADLGVQS